MSQHLRVCNKRGRFKWAGKTDELIIERCKVLASLAQAQATLHQAGVRSALPHFIALVKEIEEELHFTFEYVAEGDKDESN